MKYQNFIMRILCLLLILAAVVGYNSMQKKDTQAQESQEITALTKRVEKLEEQQDMSALMALVNDQAWEKLSISGYQGAASANFYTIYQQYFSEQQ